MTVRAKRGYTQGRHSFDFKILNQVDSLGCVGVVHQLFDPRIITYLEEEPHQFPTGYWREGAFWDVAGRGRTTTYPKVQGWQTGDIVGVMLDFEAKEIHYYLNSVWQLMQPIWPLMTKLWPAVTLYAGGDSIQLLARPQNYSPGITQ